MKNLEIYAGHKQPIQTAEMESSRTWSTGLEDPRGQLTMSLALTLDCQSLALAAVLDIGLEH